MLEQNFGDTSSLIALLATAARTASGQSVAVETRGYVGDLVFILDCAAGTGTAPTLDVVVQEADSASGPWTNVTNGAFAQVTDAGASMQKLSVNVDSIKPFTRLDYAITGTTPSFTFSVNAIGLKQYLA